MNKLICAIFLVTAVFLMMAAPASGRFCLGCLWGYDKYHNNLERIQKEFNVTNEFFPHILHTNWGDRGKRILTELMRILYCTRTPPKAGVDQEYIYKDNMTEIFARLGFWQKHIYTEFADALDNAISIAICKDDCDEYPKDYNQDSLDIAVDDLFNYTFNYWRGLTPVTMEYFFEAARARVEIAMKKRSCVMN